MLNSCVSCHNAVKARIIDPPCGGCLVGLLGLPWASCFQHHLWKLMFSTGMPRTGQWELMLSSNDIAQCRSNHASERTAAEQVHGPAAGAAAAVGGLVICVHPACGGASGPAQPCHSRAVRLAAVGAAVRAALAGMPLLSFCCDSGESSYITVSVKRNSHIVLSHTSNAVRPTPVI